MGVSSFWRKIAETADPTVTYSRSGNTWTTTTVSSVKTSSESYVEGVETEFETIDGRTLLATVTCEDGNLKQVQRDPEDKSILATINREVNEAGKLEVQVITSDNEANRVYKKV
jgi:hypothetical protein